MSYTVLFKPSAEREFRNLQPDTRSRIARTLVLLEIDPRPSGCQKLKARPGYRVRVGDHRVLYSIDDNIRAVNRCPMKYQIDNHLARHIEKHLGTPTPPPL